MSGELGKASLDLEANVRPFETNVQRAERAGDSLSHSLDALAAVANLAEKALNEVKMSDRQAAESKASAEGILQGVRGISDESRAAARELDRVRLTERQAEESTLAGDRIDEKLKSINRNANETGRALDRVKLRLAAFGGGGAGNRPGYGAGPFGAGYGRIGVLGAAVGLGALTAPAAAPGAAGLLASIPTLAAGGVGALGTLALALDGVGKAIGGDKKAFNDLTPAAKQFVLLVRSLDQTFDKLRQTAGAALFPGLTKGLRAALSPELLGTINRAVTELGHALGQAGATWGRYFGSPQFARLLGPLMQGGARNIGVLSDAFLHLFNAVATTARAAIPFTNFITDSIDKGAKLVDTWVKTKDASGGLSRALGEAEKSLKLIWGLFGALVKVAEALGKALYPVAQIAVKDLTDGLNALAGIIDRNKQTIRDIVNGALAALVSTVKFLTPIVRELVKALEGVAHAVGGWKTAFEIVIGGLLASRLATLAGRFGGIYETLGNIGPRLARIGLESEAAVGEVGALRGALLGLGAPEVIAAIAAAAAAYKSFTDWRHAAHQVDVTGQTASTAIGGTQDLGKIRRQIGAKLFGAGVTGNIFYDPSSKKFEAMGAIATMNGAESFDKTVTMQQAAQALGLSVAQLKQLLGTRVTGVRDTSHGDMRGAFANHGYRHGQPGTETPYLDYLLSKAAATPSLADDRSVLSRMIAVLKARRAQATTLAAKTALQNAINADAAQLQAAQTTPYGSQPPFTKNTGTGSGKPALIPPAAAHDEALASANASRASVRGNVGAAAKRYLEAELSDLTAADKLIRAKYETSTGKARTSLFAALTSVENKMRTVRERIAKAIKNNREAELKFAIDQAKEAAAAATVGSAAYDKAISAEEKALRALIAYEDKRVKNTKLAIGARDKAARAEESARRQLKALLKQTAVNRGENEAQFLNSVADIERAFAPNAFPTPTGTKTDTHLYDLVQESRETNDHLVAIRSGQRFPASRYAAAAAGTVTG